MEPVIRDPQTMSWSDIKAVLAESTQLMKETYRLQQETEQLMKETDRRMKETDRRMKETDRQMKETDRKYRQLADQFTSTTGHITEGILAPSALRMFKKAGFAIDRCIANLKKSDHDNQSGIEVDLLLIDTTQAIAVEVKTDCRKKDVDRFLEKMPRFKKFFPEYNDKEVFVATAALKYDKDAMQYAQEKGLLVISTADGDFFTLNPFNRARLTRF
ncbi:MAG: hypothetical protein K5846_06250 [Bacteroidales bacterium]|nr:hypothetical protein [Bacteroidales bacterium]